MNYSKTEFDNLTVRKNAQSAMPIGLGGVDGVQLKINRYKVGGNTEQDVTCMYYGSSNNCSCELLRATADGNHISPVIPCTDMSEIFVQYIDGTDNECELQIIKYYL